MNRGVTHIWRRRGWLLAALLAMALLVVASGAWVLSMPQFGGKLEGDRLARARANPQYRVDGFVNQVPPAPYRAADLWSAIKGQFFGEEVRVPPSAIPVHMLAPDALQATLPAPSLRAFWIGHASVYVEIDGLRMLIDPIFSEYASPFDVGPRRFHPPPLRLSDLPPIHAVLITHDHYDHLDMRTIQYLARHGASFFVPLGIGAHLQAWDVPVAQFHELEWWQEQRVRDGRTLCITPAARVVSSLPRQYPSATLGIPRHAADRDTPWRAR